MDLNQGQKDAVDNFLEFLFSEEKYYRIKGGAGVGKTYLMKYMATEVMKQYEQTLQLFNLPSKVTQIEFTATTNKAASILNETLDEPVPTIHAYLGLRVKDDYNTGKTSITHTNNTKPITPRTLLFIDESSYIDSLLHKYIDTLTDGCKVVFVGDHNQLTPVGESISPVYGKTMSESILTTPVRNAEHIELQDLCNQFVRSVETDLFVPIQRVEGVIDVVTREQLPDTMDYLFNSGINSKVVAYTNNRVQEYNNYCLGMQGYDQDQLRVGQTVILNSAYELPGSIIPTESQHVITHVDPKEFTLEGVRCYSVVLGHMSQAVAVPVSKSELEEFKRRYAREKIWHQYFTLKNRVADLRPQFASTVHKAQGSTYDVTFVDLEDIGLCRDTNQAARLLYVGLSRAKSRIILYGDLPNMYGGEVK